ncbi:uncharacterized protein B0H18DRAFT_949503 [Fomitopsis serialis]|uniref:uncharacterized protein n=1 Tax=Fomitopsis serialis TaxID=139415 RepID=UPI002008DDC3|nr:uncharacterized protein B0H18DRAFT_949503 [Neoantrodia serialis]KAH9938031.1 hypothetical protein B0H18DRAFT_949503 [Neoantrodia serialis]
MPNVCAHCQGPATRLCKGCTASPTWYCSTKCQKVHWPEHRFQCASSRELTTADHLVRAIYRRRAPEDDDTLAQYGFSRLWRRQGKDLFELYISVIADLGVSARKLHQWRVSGRLLDELTSVLERHPGAHQRYLRSWLSQNPWILDRNLAVPPEIIHALKLPAMLYAGLPAWYTDEHIINDRMPLFWSQCFSLCVELLPDIDTVYKNHSEWVVFGFCTCYDAQEEVRLRETYGQLLDSCTFDELYAAHRTASMVMLFDAKGLGASLREFPNLVDMLSSSPFNIRLVYFLKQYVLCENVELFPVMAASFGFNSCHNDEEIATLKDAYKRVFVEMRVDPLILHEAATQGMLFEVVVGSLGSSDADNFELYHRALKEGCPSSVPDDCLSVRYAGCSDACTTPEAK